MGCDAEMTSRRIAAWCRLMLVAVVLALPIASAPAAAPAVHTAIPHPHEKTAATAATTVASVSPASGLHRTRHPHRTAPLVAAVATAGVALVALLICAGIARRRASQLVGAVRRWSSSRAPPSRTSSLVPFGYPSGRAGRFSRSSHALLSRSIPNHC